MKKFVIPKKSDFVEVKISKIHGKGLFAIKDIPKDTEIIQYGGEKISKKEAEKRIYKKYNEAEKDSSKGENYIFDLNKKSDIDGDFEWNIAKFINHSCNTNTDLIDIDGEIWFVATREIKKGEEITTNYQYGLESFEDFPCRCGSKNCIGYMVAEKHRPKLKKILEKRKSKTT
ncbi:SET domain-containing protein-lysine N-methyltransferase [Candidatus Pacearchaeota archaeon]|nr:SET domain-containing protein-lysine N-methyltransferase [Candidatus Pacearchaeota archaeon]